MHIKNELSQTVITLCAQVLSVTQSALGGDGGPEEVTSERDLNGFSKQGVGRAAQET